MDIAGEGRRTAPALHSAGNPLDMKPLAVFLFAVLAVSLKAQEPARPAAPAKPAPAAKKQPPNNPPPAQANVAYGEHQRQVLDFWKADTKEPAPLLFFIHGGGWQNGDKAGIAVAPYLKEGISVVSINYRYVQQAKEAGVSPPVKAPLHDAARALQFVRSKAGEWNLDKQRIVASGGSAGACSSLWLAFHPDMADPNSSDAVARESTRLWGAGVNGAQTTLDPHQMREWTPNSRYGGHAFGFTGDKEKKISQFEEFHAKRDTIKEWIAEYSPYAHVSADDPPVYLFYNTPPALGKEEKDPTHTANFGVKLQEHCKASGVKCELRYPGASDAPHATTAAWIIGRLKAAE
jgi:acetyl esterase/lipase